MKRSSYLGGSRLISVGSKGTNWDTFDPYSLDPPSTVTNKPKDKKTQKKMKYPATSGREFNPKRLNSREKIIFEFIEHYVLSKIMNKDIVSPPALIKNDIILSGGIESWILGEQERRNFYLRRLHQYKSGNIKIKP